MCPPQPLLHFTPQVTVNQCTQVDHTQTHALNNSTNFHAFQVLATVTIYFILVRSIHLFSFLSARAQNINIVCDSSPKEGARVQNYLLISKGSGVHHRHQMDSKGFRWKCENLNTLSCKWFLNDQFEALYIPVPLSITSPERPPVSRWVLEVTVEMWKRETWVLN